MRRILLIWLIFAAHPAFAGEITGRVVGVHDGDTITILSADHKTTRIRLAEIDAPESSQPYGQNSKQVLSRLVFGKDIIGQVAAIDRYGRTVARLHQGAIDVNAQMVLQGAAWVYRQYSTDPLFITYETQAKTLKSGLWALQPDQRIPPWEWRQQRRRGFINTRAESAPDGPDRAPTSRSKAVNGPAANRSYQCGSKRYCKQMASCAEARFYLNTCGVRTIDGDGDGTPCEPLCR